MKKLIFLPLIIMAIALNFIPSVSATTYTFGDTDYDVGNYMGGAGTANAAFTQILTPTSTTDEYFTLTNYLAYVDPNGKVKAAIWTKDGSNGALLSVSSTIHDSTTAGWYVFNFDVTLTNNTQYYIGLIFEGSTARYYFDGDGSQTQYTDVNSYATPVSLTSVASSGFISGYMICNGLGAATPTPTPNPSGPPTELTDIWEMVGNLINYIVPLLVVLLPAFFGYKFAGAWGFLAGINVGAILAYVVLGAATFPLWGIVAILILDALLLFGRVGFRT